MYTDYRYVEFEDDPEASGWYCSFTYAKGDDNVRTQFGPLESALQAMTLLEDKRYSFEEIEKRYGKGRVIQQ